MKIVQVDYYSEKATYQFNSILTTVYLSAFVNSSVVFKDLKRRIVLCGDGRIFKRGDIDEILSVKLGRLQ